MRYMPALELLAIGVLFSGCSGAPAVTLGASRASYTPTCFGTSTPATTASSCGANKPIAAFSLDPTALTLCTPGAGCALSHATIGVFVGYGTIVGTVGGANASISLGATYQNEANFVMSATGTGSSNVFFTDSAFGPQQIATLNVVAAAQNDGKLSIASGYEPEPCNTEAFTIDINKPQPGVTASIANPAVATVTASLPTGSSVTVTPAAGRDASTYMTIVSGSDTLIVPLNLQACAVPG